MNGVRMLKEEIKTLAEGQRVLRRERKSSYDGVRTLEESEGYPAHQKAQVRHAFNRYTLRHMYHAYARLRGKELTPPKYKVLNEGLVQKYVDKYAPKPEEVAA